MRVMFSRFLAMAVVAIGFAAPAHAGFTGPFALGNWEITNDGATGGTMVNIVDPNTLKFIGGESATGCVIDNTCTVHFSIVAPATGNISFDWSFKTADLEGLLPKTYEQFGWGVNNLLVELTQPNVSNGLLAFSNVIVPVTAGDTFEFFYDCTDCGKDGLFGNGEAHVTNFMAPIPEPETWALMLAGIGLVGTIARRRLVK